MNKTFAFFAMLLFSIFFRDNTATAQSFFSDYKSHYFKTITDKSRLKPVIQGIDIMKKAFDIYHAKTGHNLLDKDTVAIVQYDDLQTREKVVVVWNNSESFRYSYGKIVKLLAGPESLRVETDATDWVKGYRKDFKSWVEKADTASYNRFGLKDRWFDAQYVFFTTAIKSTNEWKFVVSNCYPTVVDKIN